MAVTVQPFQRDVKEVNYILFPISEQSLLHSNTFVSATNLDLAQGQTLALDLKLCTNTLMRYSHSTKLEEHFYPNCLQYSKYFLQNNSDIVSR